MSKDKVTEAATLDDRLELARTNLTTAREQAVVQLNGIDNQLFLIDQLQHPEKFEAAEPEDDAPPTHNQEDDGIPRM